MWTPREEEILAAAMLELVAKGWKSDNGFRSGYLGLIEDSIRKEYPNTDIKGNPHITSKITAWKKSYTSLRAILSRSGVGFNPHGDYKIDCDDEQWEAIVQADKDAKFMRHKMWPLWETWKLIFGKYRTSGFGAKDHAVANAPSRAQAPSGSQCNENEYHPAFEDDEENVTVPMTQPAVEEDNSSANNEKHMSTDKSTQRKYPRENPDAALMTFLAQLHSETNSRLDVISSRIGYEMDLGKACQDVYEKLGTVDGLTVPQKYELVNILVDKPQRLEAFIGMPADARLGYLKVLIAEHRNAY